MRFRRKSRDLLARQREELERAERAQPSAARPAPPPPRFQRDDDEGRPIFEREFHFSTSGRRARLLAWLLERIARP
jgi:hypothetical protein